MNKINIISPLDKLYSDTYSILIMYPSATIQDQLQKFLLGLDHISINVYVYNEQKFSDETFKWLLDVFNLADLTIVDVDNVAVFSNVSHILSYMIAKPKTYWLTNHQQLVYNYISNNRIYDLSFLSNIGVLDGKK
jgi:hypothetical protein